MSQQMRAMVIHEFGQPNVFQAEMIPRPEVLPGHVLIRVAATSVNPLDYKIRHYGSALPFSPPLPAVLHGDVAGVVEAVGAQVTVFRPGDEVYAFAGGVKGLGGALADYLLADADLVAPKPVTLTLAQAAALPEAAITAWDGLMERAKIQAGQTILVHGATGGVGHLAIQIAKAAGANVFATASSDEKVRIACELGAEGAINYRTQSVAEYVAAHTGGKGFDVVFDSVGGANLARSCEAAAVGGTRSSRWQQQPLISGCCIRKRSRYTPSLRCFRSCRELVEQRMGGSYGISHNWWTRARFAHSLTRTRLPFEKSLTRTSSWKLARLWVK